MKLALYNLTDGRSLCSEDVVGPAWKAWRGCSYHLAPDA